MEERGALVSTSFCATTGVCFGDGSRTTMPTSVTISGYTSRERIHTHVCSVLISVRYLWSRDVIPFADILVK
ncbi:hypothetical protein BS47DRAFT_807631 [Hydnum rufescens UP504]|uniref:Uncharacterized protein n=1 Tax=Hydnum rufescens UP504 TaxID=1448309 RepID=A0A9P6B2F2_9AGAM|nr:hypothetical protein BS47DRAFT_807631 [Hydnum rufescens UP504]